jgi:glutaredoxin
MRSVVLYGAPGCHLCEMARRKLDRVRRILPFHLREIDVRSDPALKERYGTVIPVVEIDGREVCTTKVTEFRLLRALVPVSFGG